MATRRPPIPRAGRAGQPAGQRGENAAEDTGPVAQVIPLGAAPRGSRSGTGDDAGASGARPVTGRRNGGAKPAVPKSPRTKRPASEQRARERAELSGAIRAPQGAAEAGPGARSGGASAGTRGGGAPGGRPAGARSGTASGGGPGGPSAPGGGEPVPARSFSGRLLALAVVLVAITVLLLPSVGTYANQRSEIAELRESIAAKEAEQADLKQQIARWDDPVYIKQQARDRINLVMPGERKYMVIGSVAEDEPVPDNESPGEVRQDLPWVDALWDTTKRAATD